MEYSLYQKYESTGQDKTFLSILEYDIFFENNGDWNTQLKFKAQYYEGGCGDSYSPTYNFGYIMSNNSREIYEIYELPEQFEGLDYKHPSYFCGENASNDQRFLLNEFMLLYDGFYDPVFSYNRTKTVNLNEGTYEAIEFNLNTELILTS